MQEALLRVAELLCCDTWQDETYSVIKKMPEPILRKLVRDQLTLIDYDPPDEVCKLMDQVLLAELAKEHIFELNELPTIPGSFGKISLWRGLS